MKFIADFHVHTKFSIATSKDCDLDHLFMGAMRKGIGVVGTGDGTHPGQLNEIKEKLVEAELGLFRLRDDLEEVCNKETAPSCLRAVRFILTSEISNIYKRDGRTWKNHNLVFLPSIDSLSRFNERLEKIGNIHSDGRPILGLDCRNLLEVLLETDDRAFLIPAHIWTPWFSMLGSKSGFDSISDCFGDLSSHIFAVETGLSSDPPMNRSLSMLDRFSLVSNSDAHSPAKLGREANIFDTELGFDAIRNALQTGDPERFIGTYEFFPEEGKYHLDGHRKCGVRLSPEETRSLDGICPKCGKPLTLGVLYRVSELADRREGEYGQQRQMFQSMVPLVDILLEIFQSGSASRKVRSAYETLLSSFGPEIDLLCEIPLKTLEKSPIPLFAEAIRRMREKRIHIEPGYDGEFGRIRLFQEGEREQLLGQRTLFSFTKMEKPTGEHEGKVQEKSNEKMEIPVPKPEETLEKTVDLKKEDINFEQQKAIFHEMGPLIIEAGPGTGKTHTITQRIGRLITQKKVAPDRFLAVTFTQKAAMEMKSRLFKITGETVRPGWISTFHGVCLKILLEEDLLKGRSVMDDTVRRRLSHDAVLLSGVTGRAMTQKIEKWFISENSGKNDFGKPFTTEEEECDFHIVDRLRETYRNLLEMEGLMEYEDLITETIHLFESDNEVLQKYRDRFNFLFIDEYQDLNETQYRLLRLLSPDGENLCVIGDQHQAIYGFRGSNPAYFKQFTVDYPGASGIRLTRNYRSTETILMASRQMLASGRTGAPFGRLFSGIEGYPHISLIQSSSARSEAVAIGRIIESAVGGTGFHAIDFGKVDGALDNNGYGFNDFAVLFRTRSQAEIFKQVFQKAGIPYQCADREDFFTKKGIREILSFCRLSCAKGTVSDLLILLGAMVEEISDRDLAAFRAWAFAGRLSVYEAMEKCLLAPVAGVRLESRRRLTQIAGDLLGWFKDWRDTQFPERIGFFIEAW